MSADEVLATVRASGLLRRGRPVVAMLSGGRDSVCLLDLAVRLCGPEHVGALHLNYGLRAEADADERHCVELCERLGVELEVVRSRRAPAPPSGADQAEQEPSGNLQAWAREVRYAEAERLAGARDALIAAGHTASDQVETILYRLAASPGRRALLGMPVSEGRLVRPLLGVTREQTGAYCQARRRLPLRLLRVLVRLFSQALGDSALDDGRWHGHRTFHVDGTGVSMPDTKALQKAFGHRRLRHPAGRDRGQVGYAGAAVARRAVAAGAAGRGGNP